IHLRSAVAADRRRHARDRGVTLMRRQHDDDRTWLHALVEIDHILIGHADTARGNGFADVFGLVGAVNTVQSVFVALVQIHGARAHRILRARADEIGNIHTLLDITSRRPRWPFGHAADLGHA